MSETVELNGTECVVMTKAEHESQQEEMQQLEQTVSGLKARCDAYSTKLGTLEEEVFGEDFEVTVDGGEESIRERVEALENGNVSIEPETETETQQEHSGETPLEEVVSYPEQVAQEELSANAERARFIAMDVLDYAQKVPAGLVIDSSTIRKVMTAKEGERPHTQTVDRIMKFLDRFGKEETEKKKHRGRNKIVFTKEIVKRMNHTRCDGDQATDPSRGVTTG